MWTRPPSSANSTRGGSGSCSRLPSRALYEAETGRGRSRMLAVQRLVGLCVYLLYLGADYLLTPDILPLAAAIRPGLVTPLSLSVLALLLRNPQPRPREGSIAVVSVLAGFSTLFIMVMSQSPLRDAEMAAVVLVVLFVTLVHPARRPAAACCWPATSLRRLPCPAWHRSGR